MSALAAWQRQFAAALAARGPDAAPHVALHRNNAWFAQLGALEALYPAVRSLTGDECFRALAHEYLAASPSRSGDVTRVGHGFPAWIDGEFRHGDHAYFGDVARLEWCVHEALAARAAPALGLDDLEPLLQRPGEAVVLRLADGVRLLESRWTVRDIWESCHAASHADAGRVDLAGGAQRLRVQRSGASLLVTLHGPAEFALLQACARGEPLHVALGRAAALDPAFDAPRALLAFVRAGVFAKRGRARNPSQERTP